MPWADETLQVVKTTTVGFRSDSTGNLSGSWTMLGGTVNGRDCAVKTDSVNIAWAPTTRTTGPQIRYSPVALNYKYWRVIAALRVIDINQNTFIGIIPPGGTANPVAADILYGAVRLVGSSNIRVNSLGTITDLAIALTKNVWYHLAIERADTMFRVYLDTTSATTVDALRDYSFLTVIFERVIAVASQGNAVDSIWSAFTATATDATHYSGVGDILLQDLAPKTTPLPRGTGFSMPITPYTRYKSIRAAVNTYNNLVLGP